MGWRQHGGSGLGVTLDEVLELPTSDRDWLIERIGQRRGREAKEIEKAGKRRQQVALNNLGLGFVFTARDLASAKMQRLERRFSSLDERVTGGTDRMTSAFRQLGVGLAVFTAGAAAVVAPSEVPWLWPTQRGVSNRGWQRSVP